jgi:hypothetical protein
VNGDLTVVGTTIQTEIVQSQIQDSIFQLNIDGQPIVRSGLQINRGTNTSAAFMVYQESDQTFRVGLGSNLARIATMNSDTQVVLSGNDAPGLRFSNAAQTKTASLVHSFSDDLLLHRVTRQNEPEQTSRVLSVDANANDGVVVYQSNSRNATTISNVVTTDAQQTLSNKTWGGYLQLIHPTNSTKSCKFTFPSWTAGTATQEFVFPQDISPQIVATRRWFQSSDITLSNKRIDVNSCSFGEDSISTVKSFRFDVSLVYNDFGCTLSVPNASGIIATTDYVNNAIQTSIPGSLVTTQGTQVLSNKTFVSEGCYFQSASNHTKQFYFDVDGLTPRTTQRMKIPNLSGTILTEEGIQVIANKSFISASCYFQSHNDISKLCFFDVESVSPDTIVQMTIPSESGMIATRQYVTDTAIQTATQIVSDAIETAQFFDNAFTIQNRVDSTKRVQFNVSTLTTNSTRILTIPNESGTLVTEHAAQSITNKSFVSNSCFFVGYPNASRKVYFNVEMISPNTTREICIPDESGTMATTDTAQIFSNKSFKCDQCFFVNPGDSNRRVYFNVYTISQNTTREIIIPDASGTMATTDTAQYFMKKTLSDESCYFHYSDYTNTRFRFDLGNITANTTRVFRVPDSDGTLLTTNSQLAMRYAYKTISTSYSLDGSETYIFASGAITITLADSYYHYGKLFVIKNTGNDSITVVPYAGGTIDGQSSYTLGPMACVRLFADQGYWVV